MMMNNICYNETYKVGYTADYHWMMVILTNQEVLQRKR